MNTEQSQTEQSDSASWEIGDFERFGGVEMGGECECVASGVWKWSARRYFDSSSGTAASKVDALDAINHFIGGL